MSCQIEQDDTTENSNKSLKLAEQLNQIKVNIMDANYLNK